MRFNFALAALAAFCFAAPASAQYYRYARPAYAPPAYYSGAAANGFYCMPMCQSDMTPCDPPEYKRTDGRCSNPTTGGIR
jgi:hypothetical protein